ncbi:unnamed protein product [Ixodes pacificus]
MLFNRTSPQSQNLVRPSISTQNLAGKLTSRDQNTNSVSPLNLARKLVHVTRRWSIHFLR